MRWVEKHPRRPRQENLEFEASLSNTVRHCLKKLLSQKKEKRKRKIRHDGTPLFPAFRRHRQADSSKYI